MDEVSIADVKRKKKDSYVLLDTRPPAEFASGFIPGSIFLYPGAGFEFLLDVFFNKEDHFLLITEKNKEHEIEKRMAAAGFKNIAGSVKGGVDEWKRSGGSLDMIIEVETDELAMDLKFDKEILPVDLRNCEAYEISHVKRAISLPLIELADVAQIAGLDEGGSLYFYAADDTAPATAASLLKKHGLHNLRIVKGGWQQIQSEPAVIIEKAVRKEKKAN